MSKPKPFNMRVADLTTPEDRARLEEDKQRRFEDAVVTLLFKSKGMDSFLTSIRKENRAAAGKNYATLEAAEPYIETDVYDYTAKYFGKLRDDWPLHKLINDPDGSPMFKHFARLQEARYDEPDERLVFTFNWPYLRDSKTPQGSVMCLRMILDPAADVSESPCLMWRQKGFRGFIVMGSFGAFLKSRR